MYPERKVLQRRMLTSPEMAQNSYVFGYFRSEKLHRHCIKDMSLLEYKVTNSTTEYATATITLTQTKDGWQSESSESLCAIGGVKVGKVTGKGTVVVTMDADGNMTVSPAASSTDSSSSKS